MTILFGGMQFPLSAPRDGRSLLEACDPFAFTFLDYWSACINEYCSKAYCAAMRGQAGRDARACDQITNVDPMVFLAHEGFRFPLLACYPDQGQQQYDKTMRWEAQGTEYAVTYVLPPLTAEDAEAMMPLLHAVRTLLTATTEAMGDPCWRNKTNPLRIAGIMGCVFTSAKYGLLEGNDPSGYPAVEMRILVQEREAENREGDDQTGQSTQTNAIGSESNEALSIQAQHPTG